MGCYVVLLLYSVDEREGEDGDDEMVVWLLLLESLVGAKHQSSRELVTKQQFSRQGSATRKDELGFQFDLACSSDL